MASPLAPNSQARARSHGEQRAIDEMAAKIRVMARKAFTRLRFSDPPHQFHSNHYLRHNARRLEHLASLRLPVAGTTVLEVGAGIGDHSHYYLDRGCKITITEARQANIDVLRRRYPTQNVYCLDLEHPTPLEGAPFEIVHCYGTLYHLSDPALALEFLSKNCKKQLLLETCVSFGNSLQINPVNEPRIHPTQAFSGTGCRPTRPWLFQKLQELFEYVYVPTTQPNHEEYPLNWSVPENHPAPFSRAVFIASRDEIKNHHLVPSLIEQQTRHP